MEGFGGFLGVRLDQDIKIGSCKLQCDDLNQWITERQLGPVSVYCDGVECHYICLYTKIGRVVMSCNCIL